MTNRQASWTFVTAIMSILGATTALVLFMTVAMFLVYADRPPSAFQAQLPIVVLVGGSAGWIGGCILWSARIRRGAD